MFPNYIRAPNGAEAKPVSQLYEGKDDGREGGGEGHASMTDVIRVLSWKYTFFWMDINHTFLFVYNVHQLTRRASRT